MTEPAKKPRGRIPGIPVPATPAMIRANRVRAWKHGGSAKTVTLAEATGAKLREIHPEAPEILKAYTDVLTDGNVEGHKALVAQGMTAQNIILRKSVDAVLQHGALVEEAMVGPDGDQVGIKYKANPVLDAVIRLSENLGFTAEQQEMTPRSKKEGAANAAEELRAKKEANLLGALARTQERRLRGAQDPRLLSIESTAKVIE